MYIYTTSIIIYNVEYILRILSLFIFISHIFLSSVDPFISEKH
jgi:hypothetical protein